MWRLALLHLAWVLFGFVVAYLLVKGTIELLMVFGVSFKGINQSVFSAITAAIIYTLTLVIVINLPLWLKKRKIPITKQDIGLDRLPRWMDMALAPAGFVIYLLLSAAFMYAATQLIPGFNADEAQNLGFTNLTRYFEFLLAFMTLVVIAPVVEEILFRGYLYGKLRKAVPVWVAIVATSMLFGLIHGKWNVAIDVFMLSVVMCGLREITGSIWAGIMLHIMKNGLAFYLLFINPALLHTIGG